LQIKKVSGFFICLASARQALVTQAVLAEVTELLPAL